MFYVVSLHYKLKQNKTMKKAIKLVLVMIAVLASFSLVNAIRLSNDIQKNPESYVNARHCGQIKLAQFINQIK